jgi:hypothetical protein
LGRLLDAFASVVLRVSISLANRALSPDATIIVSLGYDVDSTRLRKNTNKHFTSAYTVGTTKEIGTVLFGTNFDELKDIISITLFETAPKKKKVSTRSLTTIRGRSPIRWGPAWHDNFSKNITV